MDDDGLFPLVASFFSCGPGPCTLFWIHPMSRCFLIMVVQPCLDGFVWKWWENLQTSCSSSFSPQLLVWQVPHFQTHQDGVSIKLIPFISFYYYHFWLTRHYIYIDTYVCACVIIQFPTGSPTSSYAVSILMARTRSFWRVGKAFGACPRRSLSRTAGAAGTRDLDDSEIR